MGDNSTQSINHDSLITTSTKTVFDSKGDIQATSTSTIDSSTAVYSVDRTSQSDSDIQTGLKSSHRDLLSVQYSTLRHPSPSQLPSSPIATPPLTSLDKPSQTSYNSKSSDQSSNLGGLHSVQFTNHVSPSSIIVQSSFIPPILPSSKTTTTNGSISSTTVPSSTDDLTLILGMSLCGVGLFAILVIVLFICCKKRSKKKQQTVETVQIGDLWASNRGDISYAPTFDSVLDTVSESPQVKEKSKRVDWTRNKKYRIDILYHVLYPYTAQDEGQLNLDLGDVVTLIEKRGNGWWKGKIKDKEGWFPGSYVEETEIGKGYISNHHLHNGHSPVGVSSFMKDQDMTPKLAKSHSNRNSAPVFSTDKKVLGKEVTIPKVPTPTSFPFDSPPPSQPTSPFHITGSYGKAMTDKVDGTRFHTLYRHDPNFSNELKIEPGDIVIGIEKDMNGWMKGKKENSGEIGMFPAIYVEEITQDEEPGGFKDKQSVYDKLPVCYNDMSTAEYIGVEHVALFPYAAEIETDLSFDMGDTIVVCQTLDNGWWYGCDGDQFGWFPGSYVEAIKQDQMVEDEVNGSLTRDITQEGDTTHDHIPESTVIHVHDKPLEASIVKDIAALSPIKPHGGNKSDDEISQKSVDSVEKRVKSSNSIVKDSQKKSKLPTALRPSRPAPPPPVQHHSTPESKSNLMGKFNKTQEKSKLTKDNSHIQKPEVPKRFIKPKLRKVSKKKTKAGNESELCRRKVRSPPPPRPDPPKLWNRKISFNQSESLVQDVDDSNCTQNISHSEVSDSVDESKNDANNEIVANQSVINQEDNQNMTSFMENSVITDNSFGKMSGLTTLSSSVQGERTQDQSGFTNISAMNVSDMNDSRNISNRHDSVDNSQSADIIDQPANQSKTNDSVVSEDNYVDKPIVNGNDICNDADQLADNNQKHTQKSESRLPCKLPQPKSHSIRSNSPKPSLVPKSQSLRGTSPKPPPVAPKPNKALLNRNSPCREPLYSEVGTSLVGDDVVDGDCSKIDLYKRPLSPIYSKIDKKYIVPNKIDPIISSEGSDLCNTGFEKPSKGVNNGGSELSNEQKPSNGVNNDLPPDEKSENAGEEIVSADRKDSDSITTSIQGSNGETNNRSNSFDDVEKKDGGSKATSIPGPASSYSSNIPKRATSPALKKKSISSSIPKPNFSPVVKHENDSHEVSVTEKDSVVKPERPSRSPQVVRQSSLPSASPSRLPKVEKSKSLRSESPKMGTKHQRQKMAKDVSKIPSGIPQSPKQKTPNPKGSRSSNTCSSPSRLPRKAVNGIVSPKPKRPPPPTSLPKSSRNDSRPLDDFNTENHLSEEGHLQINDIENRQNTGNLLKRANASNSPINKEELSFEEGCFIREISRDEETGMCVGMLPNGDTGVYHKSYVDDSVNEQHSVV